MSVRFLLGTLAFLSIAPSLAYAEIRISDDRGGRIGTYVDKYQGIRTSGETVVVDGLCASACTIMLGALPPERIRVTSRAKFGFHAAWDYDANGRPATNAEATQMLYSMYPQSVKRWISARGGLTPKMIFLSGSKLAGMYGVQKQPSYSGQAYAAQHVPTRVFVSSSDVPSIDRAKY